MLNFFKAIDFFKKICHNYIVNIKYSGGIPVKKITAVLLIIAAVLSLSACKINSAGNDETSAYSPDVFQSQLAAEKEAASEREAELLKEEAEKEEKIENYIEDKIEKTKKKTRLVIEVKTSNGRKYQVFEYDKKGNFKVRKIYFFLDTMENYYSVADAEDGKPGQKVIDKDKDTKMVVVKDNDYDGTTFDEMYATYSREDVISRGYSIVE